MIKMVALFYRSNLPQSLTLLKKLDLDSNRLSGVPALPPSVEVLKMNNNKIGTLSPHCFTGKAPFLRTWWLSNVLSCTDSNCCVLQGLVNLLNVELVGNALHESTVSELAFRPAGKLLSLHVDKNHFTSIPLGLPRSLQVCRCHNI